MRDYVFFVLYYYIVPKNVYAIFSSMIVVIPPVSNLHG